MPFLNRLRAVAVVVVKRVTSQPWLVVATTAGLVVAIGLMMSIPIYADAVYRRVFLRTMAPEGVVADEAGAEHGIPPFTYLFRYDGSIYGAKELSEIEPVSTYLTEEGSQSFGLPLQYVVRYAATDPFGLYADETTTFDNTVSPLVWASFAFASDIENHITILEGRFPTTTQAESGEPVEVMIHEDLAVSIGAQVGETFVTYIRSRNDDELTKSTQIPVRFAAIWRARDPGESYWFLSPRAFSERMIVPEGSFSGVIGSQLTDEVYSATWYIVMDGQDISHNDAVALLRRTRAVQQRAAGLLPNTVLGKSPVDALIAYRRSANLLTILLYAFSVPILGLLLAFILLTAGLSAQNRRNEVAVLRSRGAMAAQMLGIAALEGLLLGAVALVLGAPVALATARLIGRARSFLDFANSADTLRVTFTLATLRSGIIAVVIGIVAQVVPMFGAASHTVVSYKLDQARMLRKPWWQRMWLDVLLLIPAAYGAYLLRSQGSLVELEGTLGSAPFQDPLLFLVPALGIFALTLFFLRLMPLLMGAVSWLAAHTRLVGLLMASRHLSRTPGSYATPLILLVLTLSLSAFTASLAYTLDQNLYDSTYYQVGADMQFLERGASSQGGLSAAFTPSSLATAAALPDEASDEASEPRWYFLPVTDYLNTPGVEAVMRVAAYPATANVTQGQTSGRFMGVERASFPQIAYWRADFADESLGAMMNALALHRNGVLVPTSFLDDNFLREGDTIQVEVVTYGVRTVIDLAVVGSFEYFPTWYPSAGPLFVGDLDYLFERAGQQYPYGVWMALAPDAAVEAIVGEDLSLFSYDWRASSVTIAAEQELPERQGLFGLLSVGFAAAAVLTVMGFLLYALFSFRRRFIEFGVLRAVGLSSGQMSAFLAWELALLILMGGGLGTLLGGLVSKFFIPFLQVGADEVSRIPPYVVDVAWSAIFRIYVLFAGLFVIALVALIVMLRRMRIFEAVKLGESA
ncbi:MAG: FtsX-like permease family protein [Anaerolineae bacterium]|nr:FtsX-like permease family protein [Anaerolineae bacterium]